MSVIDVEKLLEPLSEDSPCGDDLEYDAGFVELERAAEGKAEQQMGDEVIAAEPPEWKQVKKIGLDLWGRTRDLRIASHLTQALLRTDGMPGFHDGMRLLHGLIDRHWEGVHPQLDPDDDNDPTMRVNVLAGLVDPERSLRGVREATLVSSRGLGQFSLRDVQVATGQAQASSGEEPPEIGAIDAAFLDCPVEELQATAEAATGAMNTVSALEVRLTELVGAAHAVDLSALTREIKEVADLLADRLARRGVGEGPEVGEEGGPAAAGTPRALAGEVSSREDVIRVLDRVCDYYQRHEPSSPIPLLLQRAKRLVSKDFMDVMRNVAPDAMAQIESLRGPLAEE